MDEPKKYSLNTAHTMVKQGKKVTLNGNENDYYCLRGPEDDPCITKPTLFHHLPNGSWRCEQMRVPAPTNDWAQKTFEDIDERIAFNAFIKENPPEEVDII